MREEKGDLWTFPADYRCVLTNGVLDSKGLLVMGAGVALQAKKLFPHLPMKIGKWIEKYGNRPFLCREEGLITFPTKHDWRQPSNILLIRKSAEQVVAIADKFNIRRIALPRPGCGCGGLTWDFVRPHIEDVLDDRFTVVNKV